MLMCKVFWARGLYLRPLHVSSHFKIRAWSTKENQ